MFLCMLTFCVTFGSILGSILELFRGQVRNFSHFWVSGAPFWWLFAVLCCTLFSVDFLMDFGVQPGAWGVGSATGENIPGHVFFNILP